MTLLSLQNCLSSGALILSVLTIALLWFSERSYWLMRVFFAVAVPVTIPLIVLAFWAIVTLVLTALLEFRWRMQTTWKIILWVAVFTVSSFSFLEAFTIRYELTASANLNNQQYYLIKFFSIDSYNYKLYRCETLGVFCSRSSEYIGVPYQSDPIELQYNLKTQKVYIKNRDQIIQITDQ